MKEMLRQQGARFFNSLCDGGWWGSRPIACAVATGAALCSGIQAYGQEPSLLDPGLAVRTAAANLASPTSMAFLGANDFLVLEKDTGQVRRVIDGVNQPAPVLDLPVNNAAERGLLGIALHPQFSGNSYVYLFWTESTTGGDSGDVGAVALLGHRVDRYVWNGSALTFDKNLIRLRALQADPGDVPRANHDGGVLRFGRDEKLYVLIGDVGRRGQMQNLPDGPGCLAPPCAGMTGNLPDDQFGGPEPDNAHLAGVILRLNDDGSTPRDNPFFKAGAARGGEAGLNLQKVFAYGLRNGFGMAFDSSGKLWQAENGDDCFTELNIIEPGANLGWVQVMGPVSRVTQFKSIETSGNYFGLQQPRWPPTNVADNREEALLRLFHVFEGGNQFGATMKGSDEVPAVSTSASATLSITLKEGAGLTFDLRATSPIQDAVAAHIHLGGRGQNGPIAAVLFENSAGADFKRGESIASGELVDANILALPGFVPTVANLAQRIRDGRAYVNVKTVTRPAGEIRGQLTVLDQKPVSRFREPAFSWMYEVAPAGIGFVTGAGLGPRYRGSLIIGAGRDVLQGGTLFRFTTVARRAEVKVPERRLRDKVADNHDKSEITESEKLLFGTGFGVGSDVQTGPNGNLYVVSYSKGAIYEISRRGTAPPTKP